SLIGTDFFTQQKFNLTDDEQLKLNCFDWEKEFPNIFKKNRGFNIVIGNPPYETTRSEGISDEIKNYFRQKYETAEDKFDYYVFFIEQASLIAKPETGSVALITPSTYLMKPLSTKLRRFLVREHKIKSIDEFQYMIFKATVPTAIIIFDKSTKNLKKNKIQIRYSLTNNEHLKDKSNAKIIKQELFNVEPSFYFNIYADSGFHEFLYKLNQLPDIKQLGELAEIYNGIQTGDDKQFTSNKQHNKKWRPVIVGFDINRYVKTWGGKYVLYEPELLHSNTRNNIFKTEEKIIIRQTSDKIIAAIDNEEYYALASTFIIKLFEKEIDYKCLLGILNSKLFLYLYQNINNEKRRIFPQIKKKHIFNLPIKIGFTKLHDNIISLVDQMLQLKLKELSEQKPQMKTILQRQIEGLDQQIDQAVYSLYDLTEDEIKIVEGK
ncbi:MAG: Eco57I restriction-modification methylase domain-containing protein, partial [Planctomycetaceae bacterium]|nr:Eco57I restriction-modification methylase domain-containing protein [Planctomycetaceae bacterium]